VVRIVRPAELTPEQQAWLARDLEMRARAERIAERTGRALDDLYRTLKNLGRSPSERLALGLRHARLHPKYR
jgi:hypothetical protein